MTRFPRRIAAITALLTTALLTTGLMLAAPLSASAHTVDVPTGVQDFSFDSYSADYYLARDAEGHSTLRTVETLVAKFPSIDQNRGIIRAIPNDYDGVPLHTAVVSVTDATGAPVHFDATDSGDFTELALGTDDYVHGKQSYVITYTQQNVVRAFTDTGDDELYWDTNGTGFAQPFGNVTARVHIDPAIVPFLTGNNACYRGAQGATDRCDIAGPSDDATAAGGQQYTATTSKLASGENMTVVIGFTLGTFVQVPAEQKPVEPAPVFENRGPTPWWGILGSVLVMVLAVGGAAVTIVRRILGPHDAKGSGIIIPQYTVPKDLNLLEAAELIGRSSYAVPAQIVSFAVRGKLRILDYPVTAGDAKYTLQFLDQSGLDDQELRLLLALFGGSEAHPIQAGAVREIGVVNDKLARSIGVVKSSVPARIIAREFKVKRSSSAGFFTAGGNFLLIFLAVGLTIFSAFVGAFSAWGIGSVFVAFICLFLSIGFAWRPAVLTASGAEQRDYLLGMRDYLRLAEADRFRMLQSPEGAERVKAQGFDVSDSAQVVKLYEKLLPFAVLWGVEREWSKELAVYYEQQTSSPDWYVTNGAFNGALFAQSLGGLSSAVTTSATVPQTTSSWSGSSGGSFSGGSFGGGFSGGGGGGGGGGGR
ncbi:MAG: DUF2207 domain-containing protein [Lacisediminihabitans sp.]